MTLIRRPNPFGELLSLRQAMDRLFEDSYVRPRSGGSTEEHALALDIYTQSDALVVEAALPGVKPDDVQISVLGDTLTISASTSSDESRTDDGYSYREIRRGSFSRTVTLPGGLRADDATASFENGLLRLSIPKAEEAKPRQIQIKPNGGQASTVESTAVDVSTDGAGSDAQVRHEPTNEFAPPDTQAANQWQSTNQPSNDEWQTGSQNGDQWQSTESQTNPYEPARVEQGS
jgi:HSP20 family protein